MASKQIVWSIQARNDQMNILEFWYEKNKSTVYPQKLFILLNNAIETLAQDSISRRLTEFTDVYVKIVRDYKIYFKEDETSVFIITIWDARQNPSKLKKIINKTL